MAITALYYHGLLTIQEVAPAPAPNWTNNFDKLSAFATVEAMQDFLVYAGFGLGWDHKLNTVTGSETKTTFRSTGWFVEPYYHFNKYLGSSLRFDFFDPSNQTGQDEMTAATFAINGSLDNGAQAILEYQFLHTQGRPSTNLQTLQLAIAYAY